MGHSVRLSVMKLLFLKSELSIINYKTTGKDTGSTSVSVYPQSITKAELIPKVMMAIRWLGANSTEGTWKTPSKNKTSPKKQFTTNCSLHYYGTTEIVFSQWQIMFHTMQNVSEFWLISEFWLSNSEIKSDFDASIMTSNYWLIILIL